MQAKADATASRSKPARRLGWLEASLWMGATLPAWWRIVRRGHGSISAARVPAALCDGAFATANSVLAAAQRLLLVDRRRRALLPPEPLLIVGHWRSGTTLMHELMALDSRWRTPTSFECFLPAHFATSRYWLARWSEFVLPRLRPPDQMAMGWNRPQEDEFAMCLLGAGSLYDQIAFPQRLTVDCPYLDLAPLSQEEQSRWRRTWESFLEQLQAVRPGRILLKSPTHTYRIPWILDRFRDARFVLLVRNPYDVFGSTCKLWNSLFVPHGYQPWAVDNPRHQQKLESFVLELMERMIEHVVPLLESEFAPRFRVVRFEDFIAEPITTLCDIYRWLDLDASVYLKSRWETELAARSAHRPAIYELNAGQREAVNEKWSTFFDVFGYDKR